MIATKAFGLGVDKPDIRFVFHFEFPDSLETYAQEAGRAGRDGLPSRAVLLYRLEDKRIQNYFMRGRYPRAEELRAVLDAMARGTGPSDDSGGSAPAKPIPQPLDSIAEFAGAGRRRTQVILYLLREAGLVRRTRSGYLLKSREPLSDEQVKELLAEYTDRAARDKERLADMMHYAQTPGCRTQVLRVYFGEDAGEPCHRCDNCDRGLNADEELKEAKTRRKRARKKTEESQASAPEDQPVIVIESMHGEIHTTAPETLPITNVEPFAAGDRVRHKSFGLGRILDINHTVALVHFPKAGDKRVHAGFLRPAK